MKRREFLGGLCAMALARTQIAEAREPVRRIGMLMPFTEDDPEALIRVATFSQKLRELGWVVGQNIRLEARWSGADPSRTRRSATELVAIAPDVILAAGAPALIALGHEKSSIPIVFVAVPDPVGQELVANLARPAGNVTVSRGCSARGPARLPSNQARAQCTSEMRSSTRSRLSLGPWPEACWCCRTISSTRIES